MEHRGSMSQSQGLSKLSLHSWINAIPVFHLVFLRSILRFCSHLHLGLRKGLLPEGFSVKKLRALLHFSILTTWPTHLNFLDLITPTILRKRYKLWRSSLKNHNLMSFGSKYSPQDYFFKYSSPAFFPECKRLISSITPVTSGTTITTGYLKTQSSQNELDTYY